MRVAYNGVHSEEVILALKILIQISYTSPREITKISILRVLRLSLLAVDSSENQNEDLNLQENSVKLLCNLLTD
jgi:hypothetical protein